MVQIADVDGKHCIRLYGRETVAPHLSVVG
jgi:hypothetical protein